MTPERIELILREALTGHSPHREQELYLLMQQTWPRLAKNISEIKNAVIGLEWNITTPEPKDPSNPPDPSPSTDLPTLLETARLHMRGNPITGTSGWEGTLRALLDAWVRGIALTEIHWEATPHGILPRASHTIPPWHYGWATDTGHLQLYPTPGDPTTAIPIPPGQFLIAIHNTTGGHPSGGSLLRPLAFWWAASNFSAEWFLNFAQIFGQPFRWANYDRTDPDAAPALAAMMESMGSSAYGIGPEGTTIEFHDAGKGGSDNPQIAILDRADRACDILLLGQTLTTDVGSSGSRSLGEVHNSIRADIVDAAAGWLAEILNEQLIPALVTHYTGTQPAPATLPWFEPTRKQTADTKLTAETIEILVRAGLPIPKAWAYTTLDIPEPTDGEPTIQPPAPQTDLAPALAAMPVEARAYMLSHMRA